MGQEVMTGYLYGLLSIDPIPTLRTPYQTFNNSVIYEKKVLNSPKKSPVYTEDLL
jgi:hypothetical protein